MKDEDDHHEPDRLEQVETAHAERHDGQCSERREEGRVLGVQVQAPLHDVREQEIVRVVHAEPVVDL
jgi:hypothetical protein